jgi:glycosyltransferase involved in cell wall biosynthesis
MPALRRLLGERRFDVVHFHNVSLLGPGALTLVPPDAGVATLYTTHEHWLVCPTHVLWKHDRRPCDRPRCLPCVTLARRPPQLWRYTGLLERACAHVDRFLAPSRTVAATHAARGFTRPMTHLPGFVERADDDWRDPPPRPHPAHYFLYVGRLEALKGVAALVEGWRDLPWDLLIAGTGTLEPALRKAVADRPRVRLLGAVAPDRLGALYVHALACIVPSVGHEVFPLVVPEALSRKTPVIARDFGALGEVAAESGGALLFRDDAELRAALHRIAGSPELRAALGERGYRTVVERWSPEAHLEAYLALIDDVLREKRAAAAPA